MSLLIFLLIAFSIILIIYFGFNIFVRYLENKKVNESEVEGFKDELIKEKKTEVKKKPIKKKVIKRKVKKKR